MHVGRFILGDWVPLEVQCLNGSGTPTAPTAAPQVSIYDASGTEVVADQKMPPKQKGILTGAFLFQQRLTSSFSAGVYIALIKYAISGSDYQDVRYFQVVAGGNATGAYIGLHHYRTPHADYVIGLTDGGTLEERKNQRV